MHARPPAAALGAGVTVFLVAAVAVIEALPVAFSALVGLPVGAVAGLVTAAGLLGRYDDLTRGKRAGVDAAAGFGFAVLAVSGAAYVNLLGPGPARSLEGTLAVALGVAALAGAASVATTPGRETG